MPNNTQRHAASSLATLVRLAGRDASPEVGSDSDRKADFAGYHRFALLPRARAVVSLAAGALQNQLAIARIEQEVKEQMQRKGYALTDLRRADLVIDFDIGARERIDVQSGPVGVRMGPGPMGPSGKGIDVRQVREGTIVVDMFDAHTRQPVWHGWAHKQLTAEEIEQSSAPIHEAVESVLAQFPLAC